MYLIRVLCNFYDNYQFKRQVKLEQREWLRIAKEYAIYKDLQCLISEKYIERKRIVNGDSYKIVISVIGIVCIIAYLLTFLFTERNLKNAIWCHLKFNIFLADSLFSFIKKIEHTLSVFIVQKDFKSCEFDMPWIICKIVFPFGFY
jgi:hypothetical protein